MNDFNQRYQTIVERLRERIPTPPAIALGEVVEYLPGLNPGEDIPEGAPRVDRVVLTTNENRWRTSSETDYGSILTLRRSGRTTHYLLSPFTVKFLRSRHGTIQPGDVFFYRVPATFLAATHNPFSRTYTAQVKFNFHTSSGRGYERFIEYYRLDHYQAARLSLHRTSCFSDLLIAAAAARDPRAYIAARRSPGAIAPRASYATLLSWLHPIYEVEKDWEVVKKTTRRRRLLDPFPMETA